MLLLPAGNNREAEEKHTLMLSAEGNSAAGVGGVSFSARLFMIEGVIFQSF